MLGGIKNRRPLKTVSLSAPEYRVPSHMLINGYIEKSVQVISNNTNFY